MAAGRYRRTGITAGVVAALVALVIVAPARTGGDFAFGTAHSKAEVIGVGPVTASLNAGIIVGQSIADYQHRVGRAQSRAIDTTIYGTSLTAEPCDGGNPAMHHDDLPATNRVDSREEGAADGRTVYWPILPRDLPYHFDPMKEEHGGMRNVDPGDDSPFRVDTTRLYSEATDRPSSLAVSDAGVVRVGGVADVVGGRAETATEVDGTTRIARAVVDIPRLELGDGAVVFTGLRWRAEQTTGPDAPHDFTMDASFRVEGVEIGGVTYGFPDPASDTFEDQANSLLELVNAALLPTGLRVEFPRVTEVRQTVGVTPLLVTVDRPPLGRALFNHVPSAVYDAREPLVDALVEAECRLAAFITLGDIFLAVPAGAGNLDVAFGGTRVVTDGRTFENPFAARSTAPGLSDFVPPGASETPPLDVADATTTRVAGTQLRSPAAPGTGPGLGDVPFATSPGGFDGTASGAATEWIAGSKSATAAIVGLIGLLAVLGVAVLDFLRPRRTGVTATTVIDGEGSSG